MQIQREKGNKSPKRKGQRKVQIKIGKSKLVEMKKKSFLRPRCKIAVKIQVVSLLTFFLNFKMHCNIDYQ